MGKFIVSVNGNSYQVEVVEVLDWPAPQASLESPPEARPAQKETPSVASGSPVIREAGAVFSPMPGTVLNINVKKGDEVKKGQVLLTVEAMKMENEIPAPADGKVLELFVSKGSTVKKGDLLVSLG